MTVQPIGRAMLDCANYTTSSRTLDIGKTSCAIPVNDDPINLVIAGTKAEGIMSSAKAIAKALEGISHMQV